MKLTRTSWRPKSMTLRDLQNISGSPIYVVWWVYTLDVELFGMEEFVDEGELGRRTQPDFLIEVFKEYESSTSPHRQKKIYLIDWLNYFVC